MNGIEILEKIGELKENESFEKKREKAMKLFIECSQTRKISAARFFNDIKEIRIIEGKE